MISSPLEYKTGVCSDSSLLTTALCDILLKQSDRMALSKPSVDQTFHFLIVGKTGSGKSSTGNTILGEDVFDVDMDFTSVTSTCTLHRKVSNETHIEVMDSPGLFDTSRNHEEVAADVVQALACLHPGITAVLYVMMLGTRYTEEESRVYERLKALLDSRVTQYMIIIFTRGDDLKKKKKTIDKILLQAPEGLQTVLRECDNRYVVFDNMADFRKSQVEELLEVVHKLSQANGGKPYTCPKYSEIGIKMEEEVARRMQEVEEIEVKATTYGLKLMTETKEEQEKAERKKKELEAREKDLRQKQVEMEEKRKEFEINQKEREEEMRKKHQEMQENLIQIKEEAEKQRKEFERKKEETDEQMRKKDQEMQEKKKQIEEAAVKQKIEFEKKEKERNEQMKKSEEERKKQHKSLKESLDKQQLSAERMEQELKKAEIAREKEGREMEHQSEKDRRALENIQQQMKLTTQRYEELLEKERKDRKAQDEQHQSEMMKLEMAMKDQKDWYQMEIQKFKKDQADRENEYQHQVQKFHQEREGWDKLYHLELQKLRDEIATLYCRMCVVQ